MCCNRLLRSYEVIERLGKLEDFRGLINDLRIKEGLRFKVFGAVEADRTYMKTLGEVIEGMEGIKKLKPNLIKS